MIRNTGNPTLNEKEKDLSQDEKTQTQGKVSYEEAINGITDFVTNGSDRDIINNIVKLGDLYSGDLKEAIDSKLRKMGKEDLIPNPKVQVELKPAPSNTGIEKETDLSQDEESQKQGQDKPKRNTKDEKLEQLLKEQEERNKEFRNFDRYTKRNAR